jgi:hypothetical protein
MGDHERPTEQRARELRDRAATTKREHGGNRITAEETAPKPAHQRGASQGGKRPNRRVRGS